MVDGVKRRVKTKLNATRLTPSNGKTFADVVATIHNKGKPGEIRVKVMSIQKTKTGGVILELG